MNIKKFFSQLTDDVITPITEYLEEDGDCCVFSKKDVAKCEKIITSYLSALDKIKKPDDKKIMREVKTVVLALNKLNKKTKYSLIETMEREAIWEIIQTSAVECGLSNPSDDITEEWREW
jgi:hypothetical protein